MKNNVKKIKKRSFDNDNLIELKIRIPKQYHKEVKDCFEEIPIDKLVSGLKFIRKRYNAEEGGYLSPGRKSLIKKEIAMINKEQAIWRLKNWKKMIQEYKEKGYSYPTISRIKNQLLKIANE
ncbi:MAG: hypothetical protein ACPKQO_03355 [Nitrososphaeraceae archaeon]